MKSMKPGIRPVRMPNYTQHKCPVPDCPEDDRQYRPFPSDPNCICNKPMMIYIPPGQHIHCPSHPKYIIRGSGVTC